MHKTTWNAAALSSVHSIECDIILPYLIGWFHYTHDTISNTGDNESPQLFLAQIKRIKAILRYKNFQSAGPAQF